MQIPFFIYSTQYVFFTYYLPITFLKGIISVLWVCVCICDREILRKRVSWVGCKQTCKQAIIISVQIKDRYSAAQTKCQIKTQNYGWFPERDDDFTRLLLLLFKKKKMRYLRQGMWRNELLAESTTHRMWASTRVVRCDWRNEVLSETWGTANSQHLWYTIF